MNKNEEVIINDSLEEGDIDCCAFLANWFYTHNDDVDIPCMSKSCKDCIKERLDRCHE